MATCNMQNSVDSVITSYTASVNYVKHLVKVSLVNIVYHRVNVNPNAFEERRVNEYTYMACKTYTDDPIALPIFYAARGVADAIKNKCVREVYLILKNKVSGEIYEYYKFSLTYKENPESITLPKPEEIIKASKDYMKNIKLLGKYEKLSPNLDIKVEMSFFNDIISRTYMPPYFEKCNNSVSFIQKLPDFGSPPILVGYINTGYHKIKCRATGQCASFNNAPVSTPQTVRSNKKLSFNDEENNFPSQQLHNNEENKSQADSDKDNNKKRKFQGEADDLNSQNKWQIKKVIQNSICTVSDISEKNLNTTGFNTLANYKCPCEVHEEINGIQKIKCSVCLHQQHTVCAGFENAISVPDPYVCIYCKQENRPATDKVLSNSDPKIWKDFAALRLGLIKCKNSKNTNRDLTDVVENFPEKIQYHVCEMLKNVKVVEKGENKKIKFNYQLVEEFILRTFNVAIVPDSLQLCDEDTFQDDKSTEIKKMLHSSKKTEKSVATKRMRRALKY